jgi:hypothetical protein
MTLKYALAACLAAAATTFVACGDDDDDDEKASEAVLAAFELSGSGDKPKMSGPSSIEAGVVRVEFTNPTKEDAGATLISIEGGHSAAEAVKAGQAWGDGGKTLPDWVRFVGGSSSVRAGGSFSSVEQLPAGNYAAVDINTNAYTPFEVTGEGTGELPSTDARISSQEYSFEASGLAAGEGQVLFTNEGDEPHFALLAPIKPGKTIADVRRSIREEEEGPAPIVESKTVSTGILDGGESQVVNLSLEKGKVALVCFIPDRKGGPPHAFKGMVSEATVE